MVQLDSMGVALHGVKGNIDISVEGIPLRIGVALEHTTGGSRPRLELTVEDVDDHFRSVAARDLAGWVGTVVHDSEAGSAVAGLAGRIAEAASAATSVLRVIRAART